MKNMQVVGIVLVVALVAIFATYLYIDSDNDDNNNEKKNNGLTGTYVYESAYKYGSQAYVGTWTISLKNGDVTKNTEYIQSTPSLIGGSGADAGSVQPMPARPIGYVDNLPKLNGLLIGKSYLGNLVTPTMHGEKNLAVYLGYVEGINCRLYADTDSGMIYRIVTNNRILDGNVATMVYDLKQIR